MKFMGILEMCSCLEVENYCTVEGVGGISGSFDKIWPFLAYFIMVELKLCDSWVMYWRRTMISMEFFSLSQLPHDIFFSIQRHEIILESSLFRLLCWKPKYILCILLRSLE